MNKLVSVIVPCWNGGRYLPDFLECIVRQTYRPIELCFVDDGSTDDTAEIFNKYLPRMRDSGIAARYVYQENRGLTGAICTGLKLFSGEYLTWADSDDLLAENNILAKVEYLEQHPEIALVRNDANFLQGGLVSRGIAKDSEKITRDIFEDILLEKTFLFAGCYMMRSALFRACYPHGSIPLSRVGQNLQLLLPAASRSQCGFVDDILMTYRLHQDSLSHETRSVSEQFRFIKDVQRLLEEIRPHCSVDIRYYDELINRKISWLKSGVADTLRKRSISDEKNGNSDTV